MDESKKPHPFLDDLADHVVLLTSVLRQPVAGRDRVLKVVKAGASQYVTQTPLFLGSIGDRTYFEYKAALSGGEEATGLVSIVKNADGEVIELHIGFSPLGAILRIADGVQKQLAGELSSDSFL